MNANSLNGEIEPDEALYVISTFIRRIQRTTELIRKYPPHDT